jgi:hypothetical protein
MKTLELCLYAPAHIASEFRGRIKTKEGAASNRFRKNRRLLGEMLRSDGVSETVFAIPMASRPSLHESIVRA